MSSATFTQTRSQALNLEKKTDTLLSKFSQFQHSSNTDASEEEDNLENSIIETLHKRDGVLGTLTRISESDNNISTSKLQQLQRHKEILAQHKNSFKKIKDTIQEERNRNNLLFSVRSDIESHRQGKSTLRDVGADANDYILDESVRADNANSFADRLLQQAYATRDELYNQRLSLNNALQRMLNVLQQVPGLNVLISRINTRRKRDTLILASVIAICIIFLFFL